MTLITLPKWAALIVYVIFWPGISSILCVWLTIDSGYNWTGFAAGISASIAVREMFKLKEIFFSKKGVHRG